MILGMSFCEPFLKNTGSITEEATVRNAYTLLDFGSWIDGGADQQSAFIQMLPVTTVADSRRDFVQVRLGGNDTISDPRWALLPASQMQHSPISAEEKKKMYQEMILSRWPYIFAGCFVFVLIVSGCCIWRCCKRRKARLAAKKSGNDKYSDVFSKDIPGLKASTKRQSYIPLEGSTTDLRNQFGEQVQQPNLSYTGPDPRQSAHSAHSQLSNYSQQSPSYGYPQHDGRHMQHGMYPPQQF